MIPKTCELRKLSLYVAAAIKEIDIAIDAWEVVRPADSDERLIARIDKTLEGNAFLIVRNALHAQTILALSRLWDDDRTTLGFARIDKEFAKSRVIRALEWSVEQDVVSRIHRTRDARSGELLSEVDQISFNRYLARVPDDRETARSELLRRIEEWRRDFERYSQASELRKIRTFRNKTLAHRDMSRGPEPVAVHKLSLRDVGRVLRASESLVESAQSLVGHSLRFIESHRVSKIYADRFWSIVRSASRNKTRTSRITTSI